MLQKHTAFDCVQRLQTLRQDIIGPQNRPTKLVFWYFFTFVCRNACFLALFTKSSNFVTLFCWSRSYKNRPHFCSTKLAYKKTNWPSTTAVLQFFGIIFWVVHLCHTHSQWVTCQKKAPYPTEPSFLSQNFDFSAGSDFVAIMLIAPNLFLSNFRQQKKPVL